MNTLTFDRVASQVAAANISEARGHLGRSELCPPAQKQYKVQQQIFHLYLHINVSSSVDFDLTLY